MDILTLNHKAFVRDMQHGTVMVPEANECSADAISFLTLLKLEMKNHTGWFKAQHCPLEVSTDNIVLHATVFSVERSS